MTTPAPPPATGGLDGGARFLLVLASLIVVIAGLRAAAALIVPFLVSLFLALVSLPLVQWLRERRCPAPLSILAAVGLNLAALGIILALMAGSFQAFTEAAPRYQVRLAELGRAVPDWLAALGVDSSGWVPADLLNPGMAFDLVTLLLRSMAAVLSNIVLVFLTMVFILFEATGFRAKLGAALGAQPGRLEQADRVRLQIQRYLGIKTLTSLATGVLVGLAMTLAGVDFPVVWGLIAFVLNYIPTLGSILAAVPAVLLALVQHGPGRAVVVTLVYLGINLALGTVVEPMLMGRRLGLSTLVVFVSMVFWGWVWGPLGMLLSVPLTMMVKIMLENTATWQWVALLLEPGQGGGPGPRPA